jgi:colicin import membrane protein
MPKNYGRKLLMKQNYNLYHLAINKKPIFCLTLASALTFLFSYSASFAQEPNDKWQVDPEVVAKAIPSHKLTLKQLIAQAEKNIRMVEGKIKKEEVFSGNQDREEVARQHVDRGYDLYKQGKTAEAKKEWQEALKITRDLQMKGYIKEVERRSKEEEWESEKRIAAEEAAFKRMEARQGYQKALKQKAKEQKTQPQKVQPQKVKEDKEVVAKKQIVTPPAAKDRRKAALERKARERRQKEKLAEYKKKQAEKSRLEAQKKHEDELARKTEAKRKIEEEKRQVALQQELARQAKKK